MDHLFFLYLYIKEKGKLKFLGVDGNALLK